MNSSKLFTDIDQFYNFIHFAFYTSIFRLYQNTGQKTVQTNNSWYLQKGKRFQITSKVYFVRKLNVKTINYASILKFLLAKYNSLKKMWSGFPLWLITFAVVAAKVHWGKNVLSENLFFCRKQISFAHNRNWKKNKLLISKTFCNFFQLYSITW